MAPLRYAAKYDPFISLDCAPMPSTPGAIQGKEEIKFCHLATLLLLSFEFFSFLCHLCTPAPSLSLKGTIEGNGWTGQRTPSLSLLLLHHVTISALCLRRVVKAQMETFVHPLYHDSSCTERKRLL